MTKLSVNINKIATIRNARGENTPSVVEAAIKCQEFGADGITVHPRPDERHITYNDVQEIKNHIVTELNIEGFPSESFLNLVCGILPEQVTLVPDEPDVITSNNGWDTLKNSDFLYETIQLLNKKNIKTSVFVNPINKYIEGAKNCGADRIELYTGPYAKSFFVDKQKAISKYIVASKFANKLGLEVNAGHDLNLENLGFFFEKINFLNEVSIGHALISDSIYLGLENTIQMYKRLLK